MGNKAEVLKVVEDYINSAYESDGASMRKIFDDDAIGKSIFGRRNDIEGLIDIEVFKRAVDDFKAIINIHRIGAGADNRIALVVGTFCAGNIQIDKLQTTAIQNLEHG